VALDEGDQLVPVAARHVEVGDHEVRAQRVFPLRVGGEDPDGRLAVSGHGQRGRAGVRLQRDLEQPGIGPVVLDQQDRERFGLG
jgi:hypothetical protein